MSLLLGSSESSPWWVALHRPSTSRRTRDRPAAPPLALRVRGGTAADLLGAAAAVAAVALVWLLLLGAVAAPVASLLP